MTSSNSSGLFVTCLFHARRLVKVNRCPGPSINPTALLSRSLFRFFRLPFLSERKVLFVYNTIDDFVMTNLKTYAGRPIKTAEAEDIDLGEDAAKDSDKSAAAAAAAGLGTEDAEDLCSWLKESALTDKVQAFRVLGWVGTVMKS